MSVRYKMFGNLQYQLAEGALALAWLTTWVEGHGDDIRDHEGNGHSLSEIIPPHPEGCVTELAVEYHLETPTYDDFAELFAEVTAAIVQGGVATADCDYGWGSESEQ